MIKNKNFQLLLSGSVLSAFGDAILFLTLLSILGSLDVNGVGLSFYFIAASIPVFLFSLHAGAYVEGKSFRRVMITADILRVAFIILLFTYFQLYPQSELAIYTFIFFVTAVNVFFAPASASLLPKVVEKEALPKANSFLRMFGMCAKMASYGIAAMLLKVGFSLTHILIVSGLLYLLSALCIFYIHLSVQIVTEQVNKLSMIGQIKDGITYIRQDKRFASLFIILGLLMVVVSSVDIYLISYLTDIMGKSSEDLYIITTFSLIGIMVGSIFAPIVYKRGNKEITIGAGILAFGVTIFMFSLQLHSIVLFTGLMVGGVVQGIVLLLIASFIQSEANPMYIARIFSVYTMIMTGASLPGYLVLGYLIDVLNVINVGFILAVYLFVVGLLALFTLPKLEKEDITLNKHGIDTRRTGDVM